jgi:hypothetical protein
MNPQNILSTAESAAYQTELGTSTALPEAIVSIPTDVYEKEIFPQSIQY